MKVCKFSNKKHVGMSSRFFAQLGDSSDDSSSSDNETEVQVAKAPAARSVLNLI